MIVCTAEAPCPWHAMTCEERDAARIDAAATARTRGWREGYQAAAFDTYADNVKAAAHD